MKKSLSATFFIIGFATFTIYLILLFISNARISKEKRSHITNSYPYQFYLDQSVFLRAVLYVMLGLSAFGLSLGESIYLYGFNAVYLNILSVAFPLALIAMVFSNFISLNHYRIHLALSAFSFFVYLSSALLFAFTPLILGPVFSTGIKLPIFIIVGILGGICFLAMFNPKLMDWAKMNRAEENGKVFYVKPKVNYYPLYEWIFLFFMVFTAFLMFLDLVIA